MPPFSASSLTNDLCAGRSQRLHVPCPVLVLVGQGHSDGRGGWWTGTQRRARSHACPAAPSSPGVAAADDKWKADPRTNKKKAKKKGNTQQLWVEKLRSVKPLPRPPGTQDRAQDWSPGPVPALVPPSRSTRTRSDGVQGLEPSGCAGKGRTCHQGGPR